MQIFQWFIDSDLKINRMIYTPPAKANFSWCSVLLDHLFKPKADFNQELKKLLGAEAVWVGDAWVIMLAEGLKSLAFGSIKKQIVLPAYSCNEFVKAILLANLEPVFVDIAEDGRFSVDCLDNLNANQVLALLAVNTSGVVGDLDGLLAWAEQHGCYLVEDAGYSFLGEDLHGKPYGSWGHATIINMSEGKIIPCGGAAWLVKTTELAESGRKQFLPLLQTKPKSNLAEAVHLAIYAIGSSRYVYHLYQLMRKWGLADWKAMLTTEPSRLGENYATGDLAMVGGQVQLANDHAEHLKSIRPRPWNNFRQSCAIQVLKTSNKLKKSRNHRIQWWKNQQLPNVRFLELPTAGMPVKFPVLIDLSGCTASQFAFLAACGIKKQYPSTWPMYGIAATCSRKFYEQAYTLPIHEGILLKDVEAYAAVLRKMLQ
jgi:hypothetical protein